MTHVLIFVALTLLTFYKNRGWGLEHNLLGVQIEENFWETKFFYLTKKIANFFGDWSNFCEKFSFLKLILDKYLKLFFPKIFLNLNPFKV